jgi:hypothetical protein
MQKISVLKRTVVLVPPVKFFADLNRFSALAAAMGVGIAQRIDATAIFLLLEFLALGNLDLYREGNRLTVPR